MNRHYVRTVKIVGVVGWTILSLFIVKTNRELFKDIQSYQRLLKDAQEKTDRMTEEKSRWQDKYARTRESWIEWQIQSRLEDKVTTIESIELGKNYDGIAYVKEEGIEKRYAFHFTFDRNNVLLLTDVRPLP